MTPEELLSLPSLETSPERRLSLPPLLRALWLDAHGDWSGAHEIAQDVETKDGAWVHAYLHRKEGDAGNAAYWYGQARRPVMSGNLEDEWRAITASLLAGDGR
jgi:hypothetical protein